MKKRYFPKNFTPGRIKLNPRLKNVKRRETIKSKKSYKNLRVEFDILIREKHKLLSDDQIGLLWKQIGTQLLKAPQLTLEQLIDNLYI